MSAVTEPTPDLHKNSSKSIPLCVPLLKWTQGKLKSDWALEHTEIKSKHGKPWKKVNGRLKSRPRRNPGKRWSQSKNKVFQQNGVSVKTSGESNKLSLAAKNLVGACNLATANDTWMVTVRRWVECLCEYVCVCVCVCCVLWGCSESVCIGAVRKCSNGLEISQVMNLECCRHRGWVWGGREREREREREIGREQESGREGAMGTALELHKECNGVVVHSWFCPRYTLHQSVHRYIIKNKKNQKKTKQTNKKKHALLLFTSTGDKFYHGPIIPHFSDINLTICLILTFSIVLGNPQSASTVPHYMGESVFLLSHHAKTHICGSCAADHFTALKESTALRK